MYIQKKWDELSHFYKSQAGSLRYNVAIRKLVACATSGYSQAGSKLYS